MKRLKNKVNNFLALRKVKKLVKDLNKKGVCIMEIKYILKHGCRYPCNINKELF